MNKITSLIPIPLVVMGLLASCPAANAADTTGSIPTGQNAVQVLSRLNVSPQTTESSDRKDHKWNHVDGRKTAYNTRDRILERDMTGTTFSDNGKPDTGVLHDPYTNKTIHFKRNTANRGEGGSSSNNDGGIQIDHVVAYAEAYNSGLKDRTAAARDAYYNDPDVLLAVQSTANENKKDSDAAHWMPSNDSFTCDYVSLQIGIKAKYGLSVDQAEHDSMEKTLADCPTEPIVNTTQVKARIAAGSGSTSGKPSDGGTTAKPSTGKPSTDKPKYGLEDIRYIGFGDDTSLAGDWRSDRLEFDAEHAIHIDRATVPAGWKLKETPKAARDGRLEYTTLATLTSPDGSYVKKYTLYSTPFLKTGMTVAGRTPENGRVTLDHDTFARLGVNDLKAVRVPALDEGAVTAHPFVTDNEDGSKNARIMFQCDDKPVWDLSVTVSDGSNAANTPVKGDGNATIPATGGPGTPKDDGGAGSGTETDSAKTGIAGTPLASTGVGVITVAAGVLLTMLAGVTILRRTDRE